MVSFLPKPCFYSICTIAYQWTRLQTRNFKHPMSWRLGVSLKMRWFPRSMEEIYGFQSMGDPQNGWFAMETPLKIDDLRGTPHFRNPPYGKWWKSKFSITFQGGPRFSDKPRFKFSKLADLPKNLKCQCQGDDYDRNQAGQPQIRSPNVNSECKHASLRSDEP